MASILEVDIYRCPECDETFVKDECDTIVLYECNDCGTIFSRDNSADGASHRCPDCNKFSSKLTDEGCPECEEGELSDDTGFICGDCGSDTIYDTREECQKHIDEEHPEGH